MLVDEEGEEIADGPIRQDDINKVNKNPPEMVAGFEWVTMDLDDGQQVRVPSKNCGLG